MLFNAFWLESGSGCFCGPPISRTGQKPVRDLLIFLFVEGRARVSISRGFAAVQPNTTILCRVRFQATVIKITCMTASAACLTHSRAAHPVCHTKGDPQGCPKASPRGAARGSKGDPKGFPEGFPQWLPIGSVPRGVPQGVPQWVSQGVPQGIHQGVARDSPRGAPREPKGFPKG